MLILENDLRALSVGDEASPVCPRPDLVRVELGARKFTGLIRLPCLEGYDSHDEQRIKEFYDVNCTAGVHEGIEHQNVVYNVGSLQPAPDETPCYIRGQAC